MKKFMLVAISLLFFMAINAQNSFKVSGKVTDETGEALIGANVFVKSLSLGATADLNGNYHFEIPKNRVKNAQVEITASFVGFKSKQQIARFTNDELKLNFVLEEDVFQTDQVVVTGIASKTSKSVAEVAVARIDVSELTSKISYQGLSQLFNGKVAGVNLQISSGNVGSGWRFFVRGGGGLNGSGQPVIYVDGIRIDNSEYGAGVGGQTISNLSNLNPNDIENVEFLKGPAAASMYGTGGSNGVVLITTKSGKVAKAGKTTINYSFNYGSNDRYYKYDNEKYLHADTYNNLLSKAGLIREHQISVTGGTSLFNYHTSFAQRYEEGLMPSLNNMNKTSFRANIDAMPAEKLNLKVNTGYTMNKINLPQMDNNTYSWNSNAFVYQNRWNNADSAAIANYLSLNESKQFLGSAKMIWMPIDKLEIQAGAGYESTEWDMQSIRSYGYSYGSNKTGQKEITRRRISQYTYDVNARYSLDLYGVNITSILGSQILERKSFSTYSGGRFFPNATLMEIQAAAEKFDATESRSHSKSAGIYWNNEFSYDDTYFWTLAIRRDFASAIGIDAPAITYPKASLSVRLDKFDLLPKDIFGLFKVRVAYGETGQLPSLDDGIPLTWAIESGAEGMGYNFGSKGNKEIQPERIKEWEFGFDTEFLKIFSLEFTHYRQNATNSIVSSRMAPSTGLYQYSYPVNVGSVKSWGFETQLQVNPIRSAEYDLNVSFIVNYQKNEVQNLGETDEILLGTQVIKPGFAKNQFFTQVAVAPVFDPKTKKYIGVELSNDRVDLGNPVPDLSGSVSVNFRFLKNFTLYAMGEWAVNNKVYAASIDRLINYNTYLPQRDLAIKLGLVKSSLLLPRDAGVVQLTPGTPEYEAAAWEYIKHDRAAKGNFVKEADYFVLREISLSCNVLDYVKEIIPNPYLTSINMGISVRNVFRVSKYDLGFEASSTGGRSDFLSEDYNTLPQPRTFMFWAKFGF